MVASMKAATPCVLIIAPSPVIVMNEYSTEISVPARHDALIALHAAIGDACARLHIAEADCLRLQLLAEELFINTIDHGLRGNSDCLVRLVLGRDDRGLTLRYEDEAPAFNPFLPPATTAGDDSVGGLGLALLGGMSQTQHYRREGGRNIVEIGLQAP